MNKNCIYIESLYEFKRTRRSILFQIFVVLAILGVIFYQFTFLSRENSNSLKDLFSFHLSWSSQALPASIAFKSAYYFNIIQLLFVICLVTNNSNKLNTREALYVRPQENSEIVIGNFLGRLLIVTIFNWLLFTTSIIINFVLFPESFNLSYYLFYWITITFPASVYILGISHLMTRLTCHPGISLTLLLLFFGGIFCLETNFLHGLFDPFARNIPNMFSDFIGHVNLKNYLLQREYILLTGMIFIVLSIIPYPRIPNRNLLFKTSWSISCILLILTVGLALLYLNHYRSIEDIREIYKHVYTKYEAYPKAKITRNDLYVKELPNGNITVNCQMSVINKTLNNIPLVMYLNPGLEINSIEINGKSIPFTREYQVIIVEKRLEIGETCDVSIDYEGDIENSICFLDIDTKKSNFSKINSLGIYHYGYSPAFCKKDYKLLTPECIWYPVCIPPYSLFGNREKLFARYSLNVIHDPHLMAISQGKMIKGEEGETSFIFNHDMPGISLCIGNYKKRTITIASSAIPVDSTLLTLYYLPHHQYLLDGYDFPGDKLAIKLQEIKQMLEIEECISYENSFTREEWDNVYKMNDGTRDLGEITRLIHIKRGLDPTQHYPYRWFTFLEVPCNFYSFPNLEQLTGEREQGGILFIPEKLYSIKNYQHNIPKNEQEKEDKLVWLWQDVLEPIIGKGSCSVRSLFRGKTTYISSSKYPIINEVINNIIHKSYTDNLGDATDFNTTEYLKANSLNNALHDNSLSSEILQNIFRKKSSELGSRIMLQVEQDSLVEFYHNFLTSNLFKEISLEKFCQLFHQKFNLKLDSLLNNWYNTNQLPLLHIKNARAIKIKETDKGTLFPDMLYSFSVFNESDVPGLIRTADFQEWIIPPHEGRNIRARDRKNTSFVSNQHYLEIPLARNLPSRITLKLENMGKQQDTSSCIHSLDSIAFFQSKNIEEIIIDNEDPGFKVVKAKGFNILSLLRKETSDKKYYTKYSQQDTWIPMIDERFHGFPVRSALYKKAGSGKQKVEWKAQLPHEGKYEIFFYKPKPYDIKKDSQQEFHYVIFDGKEKHEVITSINGEDTGWISLGVFDCLEESKVTLSDKNRKNKIETDGYYSPQEIVADAVKWVPL